MTAEEIRDNYLATLNHIDGIFPKLQANLGHGGVFTFPDVHKLSEGLFLSAWTYWEGLLRDLLLWDLSTDAAGRLRRDVSHFRHAGSPYRLAERMLNHPDHPEKFVEWSEYQSVRQRADEFLGAGHRFMHPLPQYQDIAKMKKIRNAIAHRSDKAWESFTTLVSAVPFNLLPTQRRGLTPGRFLSSHQWNGVPVLQSSTAILRAAAQTLVP